MTKHKKEMPDVTNMTLEEERKFWDENSPLDYLDTEELNPERVKFSGKVLHVENIQKDEKISFRASSADVAELRQLADEKSLDLSTFLRLIYRHYLKNKDDISLA